MDTIDRSSIREKSPIRFEESLLRISRKNEFWTVWTNSIKTTSRFRDRSTGLRRNKDILWRSCLRSTSNLNPLFRSQQRDFRRTETPTREFTKWANRMASRRTKIKAMTFREESSNRNSSPLDSRLPNSRSTPSLLRPTWERKFPPKTPSPANSKESPKESLKTINRNPTRCPFLGSEATSSQKVVLIGNQMNCTLIKKEWKKTMRLRWRRKSTKTWSNSIVDRDVGGSSWRLH